jgi:hypothetical protein
MIRRASALLVAAVLVAGCSGAATPAPRSGGATPAPEGTNLPGWMGAGTPPPDLPSAATRGTVSAELLSVMVGDVAHTFPATCVIAEGKSIAVDGKDSSGTATFTWVGKTMPSVTGTLNGTAFAAPDLSASVGFASPHAWNFSGTDAASGKPISGSAICK